MGVHDNMDSKYNSMGSSSFSKLTPKRPNTVIFNETPNKISKPEDKQNNLNDPSDKSKISIQQQRKALPVYKLRKR